MRFTVYGTVKGKPRPRITVRGGHGHAYDPESYKGYEDNIAAEYLRAGGKRFTGPIYVKMNIYRPLPKSRPKKVELEPDTYKPDVDNIAKAVLDALNGVAYDDDKQIVRLEVRKWPRARFDHGECIVIELGEMKY